MSQALARLMGGAPSRCAGVGLAATLSAAVLAFAPALPAAAQISATADYLELMDTDGDGRVSLEEYLAWMSYAFDAMDADGDGVLAPAEQPGSRGRAITRAAYLARLTDRFNRQDLNRDGFLDARELAAPPQ